MRKILENSTIVFTAAILLAVVYPGLAYTLKGFITFSLVLSMTLSMRNVSFSVKAFRGDAGRDVLKAVLINYVLLSALILILSLLFIRDSEYFKGFVVMAAIPPAVAVVPFTYLLRGDVKTSVAAEVACYLLSLILTPLIILLFSGDSVNLEYLMELLLVMIALPLLLSRVLSKMDPRFFSYDKVVMNLCFALISYSVIGLNQQLLFRDMVNLAPVFLIMFLRTFALGTVIYILSRKIKVNEEKSITYALFGAYKNGGATATLALMLFSDKSALPAGIASIFELIFVVYFERLIRFFRKMR